MAPSALELRAAPDALLDEPLAVSVRGLGTDSSPSLWRARLRDDDSRVWRASADRPGELAAAWEPAKGSTGGVAALQSLRPVALDVRVEVADGRASSRTLTRRLLADGVKVRRWRERITATLLLPAAAPTAAVVVPVTPATLPAAALLASRGVLLFAVNDERDLDEAADLLAQVPATASAGAVRRRDSELPLAPGVPARTAPDDEAWDALLAELGARPRTDR